MAVGRYTVAKYLTDDGQKVKTMNVLVNNLYFCEPKRMQGK